LRRIIPKKGSRIPYKVMRRRQRALAALAVIACLAAPAAAQDKPDAKDVAIIHGCLKQSGNDTARRESCVGLIATPCLDSDKANSTADMVECSTRERAVWDDILNESYRRLRDALDDKQRTALRNAQRAWIASRDKSCAFYYDFFQGTMANPMVAFCMNKETGKRAVFLLEFLDSTREK
jgi:uncharacterized protein YecT (DUF1311 family)